MPTTAMTLRGTPGQMTQTMGQPEMSLNGFPSNPQGGPMTTQSGAGGNAPPQTMNSGNPLGQWSTWMNSGGVNPGGWQSLGGQPNLNFLNMSTWTQGGADPTQVSMGGDPFAQAQPYVDNAYQQATRQLDPQWEQQQRAFDQQMVNRGLAPGSQAYQQARSQFDQSRNDAYSQARDQAMTQGLGAQNQMFGQGLQQSQLANSLAQALIGANSSYAGQQLGGNASIMNALLGGNSGIAQQLIGSAATRDAARSSASAAQAAASMNAAASRANSMNNYNLGMAQLQQQGQQQDFGNLMQLLGMGQGVTAYNNGLLGSDQQRNQSMFGYLPGGGGSPIDVTGPYNNQYQGQMNQWGYQNQSNNAQNQAYLSFLGAMLCDRNAKEGCVEFEGSCSDIVRALPVDNWNYKGDGTIHIGTYAQDFNKAAGLDEKPFIWMQDMLGVLLGTVKEILSRLDKQDKTLEALARV